MRFGKTREQARRDWIEYRKVHMLGVDKYAYVPVRLHAGDWVWLEPYVRTVEFDGGRAGWIAKRYLPDDERLQYVRRSAPHNFKYYGWEQE